MVKLWLSTLTLFILLSSCSKNDNLTEIETEIDTPRTYNLLSLGDSYTIGESVCETCRFPEQLKDSLANQFNTTDTFNLDIVATTGWTTSNLISAIESKNLTNDYNLVTLLIGVNNQFRGLNFSIYEKEFPELVNTAITKANGNKNNVIVISIPDYAYTPYGKESEIISRGIDKYNNFAETYCIENNISYIYITDITRNGLIETNLVALDGLHPSEIAYTKFVERLLTVAVEKLKKS